MRLCRLLSHRDRNVDNGKGEDGEDQCPLEAVEPTGEGVGREDVGEVTFERLLDDQEAKEHDHEYCLDTEEPRHSLR